MALTSKIHGRDTRKYVIFLKARSTLYEISRERNKIFTYFFHDNKDHISGRKPLQYQLIISILSGVKHPWGRGVIATWLGGWGRGVIVTWLDGWGRRVIATWLRGWGRGVNLQHGLGGWG